MPLKEILPFLKDILLNPYVIGTTIVIFLYCNFVCYIVKYKKKPPKTKKKKIITVEEPPKQDNTDTDESQESNIED